MGYIDDYENNVNNKIPYDDTPISRHEENYSVQRTHSSSGAPKKFRVLMVIVALSLVINIGLCITTVYFILHGVKKDVNVYYTNLSVSNEISSQAAGIAQWSSVCVSAGVNSSADVKDDNTFITATLSHGAGVIYQIDRENNVAYFITCYHVISGYEKQVYVLLPNSLRPIRANTVGYSSRYDIAVLEYRYGSDNDPVEECTGLFDSGRSPQFEESYYLSLGETVFAVGNPLSGGTSVTSGVISRINTFVKVEENTFSTREIQISAEVNPGNSGGGLFNNEGKFIGLVNSKRQTSKVNGSTITVAGMAYAIPGTFVIGVARSIISEKAAVAINLGASFVHSLDIPKTLVQYPEIGGKNIEQYGVVISTVLAGSISSSGGLRAGDIVNSFSYIPRGGTEENRITVPMFNMYNFEDVSFNIEKGTDIVFDITRQSTREEHKLITVKATATQTYE